VEIFILYTW